MNKKYCILTVIDTYGTVNFAELHERLETGQSKKSLSVYLNNLKTQRAIEQDVKTKRYSLTEKGLAYIEKKAPPSEPLRDLPEDPDERQPAAPAISPQLIAEFQKLHGQIGRVIQCMKQLQT